MNLSKAIRESKENSTFTLKLNSMLSKFGNVSKTIHALRIEGYNVALSYLSVSRKVESYEIRGNGLSLNYSCDISKQKNKVIFSEITGII